MFNKSFISDSFKSFTHKIKTFFKGRIYLIMLLDDDVMNNIQPWTKLPHSYTKYFLEALVSRLNLDRNAMNNIIKYIT